MDEKIRKFVYFSLALDESTDLIDTAQLAIFVRGVDDELNVGEYVLELIPLADTTRGEDIFNAVCMCVNKHNLDWSNLASIATDGARSMIGDKKGFIGRLKAFLKEKGVENIVNFSLHSAPRSSVCKICGHPNYYESCDSNYKYNKEQCIETPPI